MNTRDPAFRRAFRRGVKYFGHQGAFVICPGHDGFHPLSFAPTVLDAYPDGSIIYWSPDGKRWRRFGIIQKVKQEAPHEKRKGL